MIKDTHVEELQNYRASIEYMRMKIDALQRTIIWYETNSDIEWRRLEEGEEVLPTDQIFYDDIRPYYWVTVGQDGCGCKAPDPQYTCHRQYRRSIAPQETPDRENQELKSIKGELEAERDKYWAISLRLIRVYRVDGFHADLAKAIDKAAEAGREKWRLMNE